MKRELDRIFSTTSFNDQVIWSPRSSEMKIVGWEPKQAVTFNTGEKEIDVTNDNCGVIAYSSYKFNADTTGISIEWTGYDGLGYETAKIDWDTLKENDYSFEMSDYFDNPNNTNNANLFVNGTPVFNRTISFSVQETTTVQDMIDCINDRIMSSYSYASMSGQFETNTGVATTNTVSVNGASIYYGAAYASNVNANESKGASGTKDVYNFDGADDVFLEAADSSGTKLVNGSSNGNLIESPSVTTVADARNSTKGWKFSFYMDGIGQVIGESKSLYYVGGTDGLDEEEGLWWHWSKNDKGENERKVTEL